MRATKIILYSVFGCFQFYMALTAQSTGLAVGFTCVGIALIVLAILILNRALKGKAQ